MNNPAPFRSAVSGVPARPTQDEKLSDEARTGTLYEFDWEVWPRRKGAEVERGTQLGWWDGRNWIGCYGDGAWSPQYIVAVREFLPAVRSREAERVADEIRERAQGEIEMHQCSEPELPPSSRYFRLGLLRGAEIAARGVPSEGEKP